MYISTFYSFKGGVGRTMALVNVAVELAQRGRKVFAVDFDLEAPGLDTFDVLRSPPASAGTVDFVREYLATGRSGSWLFRSLQSVTLRRPAICLVRMLPCLR